MSFSAKFFKYCYRIFGHGKMCPHSFCAQTRCLHNQNCFNQLFWLSKTLSAETKKHYLFWLNVFGYRNFGALLILTRCNVIQH